MKSGFKLLSPEHQNVWSTALWLEATRSGFMQKMRDVTLHAREKFSRDSHQPTKDVVFSLNRSTSQ
jgi:hypothetical protein